MGLIIDNVVLDRLMPYRNPDQAQTEAFQFAPNLTIAKGTVCGFITASKLTKQYANANVDGSEVAKVIAVYSFTTDANGKVSFTGDTTKRDTAPCYTGGDFLESELTGLDAAAIADLGRSENGVLVMR